MKAIKIHQLARGVTACQDPPAQDAEAAGELVLPRRQRAELDYHVLERRQHHTLAEARNYDLLRASSGLLAREDQSQPLARSGLDQVGEESTTHPHPGAAFAVPVALVGGALSVMCWGQLR